jgi:putative sigma-54 modulation protein
VARQIRKYKTRVVDRRQRAAARQVPDAMTAHLEALAPEEPAAEPEPAEPEEDEEVLREKLIEFTPLTVDHAILQTELLGHSFFVFTNVETGDVNVIYRRKDGGYGILKPVAPAPAMGE